MLVSGFTFVRNAIKFDYPIVEAINSILPVCDEVVVAVGKSEDDTLGLIQSINSPKIKILETVWDDSLREGGQVLAVETNKAFDAVNPDADWAFYIQGDECFHEGGREVLLHAMEKWKDEEQVDGLLFNYRHFYGSYDYLGDSRKWYRKEIRVIKNNRHIRSYRDAQGFRKDDGSKLLVKPVEAYIHHYGWVKHPKDMMAKQQSFHRMWHDDTWVDKNVPKGEQFDYSGIDSLQKFTGTHPQVMQERIQRINWDLGFDPSRKKYTFKIWLLHIVERLTGWRPGEYKNYKLM
ncbi:MAG: glycosyltransferase family 2 protein [Bacteroidia bacterium]